jgi:Family of unknown function (DUF5681)
LSTPGKPTVAVKRSPADHLQEYRWKPGVSANPAGRPKGIRNKLGEVFLDGMLEAWNKGGQEAIERVMIESPAKFLGALVTILPKQVELDADVTLKVTSAVDTLVTRLTSLASRETEYALDRADVKTIEHDPTRDANAGIICRDTPREEVGVATASDD